MAVDSLKMDADEYKHLRERNTQDWIIEELQRRSFEKGIASHDLRALREALLKNQSVSHRTHQEWQPAKVRVIDTLHKWRPNLSNNTLYILSLV